MENSKPYREFGDFLRELFPYKVQKIITNAALPVRTATGRKVSAVVPTATTDVQPESCHTEKSVTEQLEEGVRFFSLQISGEKYLAYFQAYTNTYDELDSLTSLNMKKHSPVRVSSD